MDWVSVSLQGPGIHYEHDKDLIILPTDEEEVIAHMQNYPQAEIFDLCCWNNDTIFQHLLPKQSEQLPEHTGIVPITSQDCNLLELNRFLDALSQMEEDEVYCICKDLLELRRQNTDGDVTTER